MLCRWISFHIVDMVLLALVGLSGQANAQATRPAVGTTQPTTAPNVFQATTRPAEPREDWIRRSKNPFPGFTWGTDVRLREAYANNLVTLDQQADGHEWHWERYRARWWSTLTPAEDVDFNMRICWEGRHWDNPENRPEWDRGDVLFDNLNVKWSSIGGTPLTIQAGRQDLMLGDGWLVLDGTPLDGSRTLYFDAVRLTYDRKDVNTRVDAVYIDQDADADYWFKQMKDRDRTVVEQDERGAILYLTNKSLSKTELNGYFMYKKGQKEAADGYDADIYTFGGRVAGEVGDHWKYRSELAQQFGHKNDGGLCALGYNGEISHWLKDSWNNRFRLDHEYLSGDDPDTGTNEAFDVLWGRWPRWSEMYIYTYMRETRIADMTNLHRVATGWSANPIERIELIGDYHLLFADQNTRGGATGFSRSGVFRGQLLTAWLKVKFAAHISGHLLAEFFFPGDYCTDETNDPAVFLRSELVFSW